MSTSFSAHLRTFAGVSLAVWIGAVAPAATSADTRTAPEPTPAQQTLIELHEYVGAGWWSPVTTTLPSAQATTPRAKAVPAQWWVPLAPSRLAPQAPAITI